MKTARFEFRLPQRLIAKAPPDVRGERRDHARLVVLDRHTQRAEHRRFDELGDYLRAGDVLVVNDSMVMQDELVGETRDGPATVILCGQHRDGWHVIIEPKARAKRGAVVRVAGGALRVLLRKPVRVDGMWLARMTTTAAAREASLAELIERHGMRHAENLAALGARRQSYQNVYARKPGSLEVPSAGLHFTPELLARLQDAGMVVAPITLHVGLTEMGAYRHIRAAEVEDHSMTAEWYEVPPATARAINAAHRRDNRVVAVGTTVVRTLETVAVEPRAGRDGRVATVKAGSGWTDLYLRPGHRFRIVDLMLTNLHQPRSSHLVLVAAFAGAELVTRTYRELIRARYSFDLFGDSMLLI